MQAIPRLLFAMIKGCTEGEIDPNTEEEIGNAIKEERFEFIKQNSIPIGFFTWAIKNNSVEIANMCILKPFRASTNFLSLRKYMRNKLKQYKTFIWRNRKRGKEVIWNF